MIELLDERLAITDNCHQPLLLQSSGERLRNVENTFFRQSHGYILSIRIVGTSITRRNTEASPRICPMTLTRSAGTGSCPMLIGVRPKKMARTCPAPQNATSPTLT